MRLVTRGLFVGDTLECFEAACRLSLEVNVQYVSDWVRLAGSTVRSLRRLPRWRR